MNSVGYNNEWNEFANKCYLWCMKMQPGSKVVIAEIPNLPDRQKFVEACKETMSWGLMKDFHFSDDYSTIYRTENLQIRKLQNRKTLK